MDWNWDLGSGKDDSGGGSASSSGTELGGTWEIPVMGLQWCRHRDARRDEEDVRKKIWIAMVMVMQRSSLLAIGCRLLSQSLSAVVSGLRWLVQSLWCPSSSTWCCCVDFVVNVCCRLLISLSLRHKPDASKRYGWSLWWDKQRQWVLSGCGIG